MLCIHPDYISVCDLCEIDFLACRSVLCVAVCVLLRCCVMLCLCLCWSMFMFKLLVCVSFIVVSV